eukprot:4427983-Ditylum_brightwellii.AAC.1
MGEKVYAGIIHRSATYQFLTSLCETAHCQDKCIMVNLHETRYTILNDHVDGGNSGIIAGSSNSIVLIPMHQNIHWRNRIK